MGRIFSVFINLFEDNFGFASEDEGAHLIINGIIYVFKYFHVCLCSDREPCSKTVLFFATPLQYALVGNI